MKAYITTFFLILLLCIAGLPVYAQEENEEVYEIEPEFAKLIGSDGFDYGLETDKGDDGNYYLSGYFSYPLATVRGSYPEPMYDGPFYDRDEWFKTYPVEGDGNHERYGGKTDIPITKFDSNYDINFSKTFGGPGSDGAEIVRYGNGKVYIGGYTQSKKFPGIPLNNSGKYDGLFMVLNASTSELLQIKTIGGSGFDFVDDIHLLSDGSVIVIGSSTSRDLPTVNAFDDQLLGEDNTTDIFIQKYRKNGSLEFFTYLGGNHTEISRSVKIDENDRIVIAGFSISENYPIVDGRTDESLGSTDGIISVIDQNGTLVKSTYFGGSQHDVINDIKITPKGNYMIVGQTHSVDLPITQSKEDADNQINVDDEGELVSDAYYFLMDEDFNIIFSSYIGGTHGESLRAIDMDSAGNFYLVGDTRSPDYPIHGPFTRPPKFNNELLDEAEEALKQFDMVLTKITPKGRIAYSIFFGSFSIDAAYGIHIEEESNQTFAVISGFSGGSDFPITKPIIGGGRLVNTFIMKLEIPPGIFEGPIEYPGKDQTPLIIFSSVVGTLMITAVLIQKYRVHKRNKRQEKLQHEYRESYDLIKEVMKED